jgi:hypothetical protein
VDYPAVNALSLFPVDGNTERFICLSVLGDCQVRHVVSDDIKQWKVHFPWVSEVDSNDNWEMADWGDDVLIVNTDRVPRHRIQTVLRAHDFQRIFAYPDFEVILGLASVYEREYYLVFNHNGWSQHLMWRKKIDYDSIVTKDPVPQVTNKKSAFRLFKSISRPNMRRKFND